MKTCNNSGCSQVNPQPYECFSKLRASKDGYYPQCKSCSRQKYLVKKGGEARINKRHKEYSLWTLDEENRFRKLFYEKTQKELEVEFNKSKFALLRKAQELGLKKPTYESKFYSLGEIPCGWAVAGVYSIINTKTNRQYIGSSVNMLSRILQHFKDKPNAMIADWEDDYMRVAVVKFCDNYLEEEHKYINNPRLYNSFSSPELPLLDSSDIKRFGKKYDIDACGCWLWKGSLKKGYGQFAVDKTNYAAHRISYLIHKGKYNKALLLRHQCSNPSCVNPDHLLLGTDSQNVNDRKIVGRANEYGTTWETVKQIRADWQSGQYSLSDMKEKYGFDVQAICFNHSWVDESYVRPAFTRDCRRGKRVGGKPK